MDLSRLGEGFPGGKELYWYIVFSGVVFLVPLWAVALRIGLIAVDVWSPERPLRRPPRFSKVCVAAGLLLVVTLAVGCFAGAAGAAIERRFHLGTAAFPWPTLTLFFFAAFSAQALLLSGLFLVSFRRAAAAATCGWIVIALGYAAFAPLFLPGVLLVYCAMRMGHGGG